MVTTKFGVEAKSFSLAFENMCQFVAVSQTGDQIKTIGGLVSLCLYSGKQYRYNDFSIIKKDILDMYGLDIQESNIEEAIRSLLSSNIFYIENELYKLEKNTFDGIHFRIEDAKRTEDQVKKLWEDYLAHNQINIDGERMWKALQDYLQNIFKRHGLQAAALLDCESKNQIHEMSMASIISKSLQDNGIVSEDDKKSDQEAIFGFLSNKVNDSNKVRYITQLADAAYNFFTLDVPYDVTSKMWGKIKEVTIFLDTNFLFGILGLHSSSYANVSNELLSAISKNKLPFKLRYHEKTLEEMQRTVAYYGGCLRQRTWSQALSRAALSSYELSGIERTYHEKMLRIKLMLATFFIK